LPTAKLVIFMLTLSQSDLTAKAQASRPLFSRAAWKGDHVEMDRLAHGPGFRMFAEEFRPVLNAVLADGLYSRGSALLRCGGGASLSSRSGGLALDVLRKDRLHAEGYVGPVADHPFIADRHATENRERSVVIFLCAYFRTQPACIPEPAEDRPIPGDHVFQ
jgi:hypothetical protein